VASVSQCEKLDIMSDVNNVPGSSGGVDAPASTPSSLVAGLKAHDPLAWRRLAFLCAPLVMRWCRQRNLQAADADDLLQEVFRTVLADFPDCDDLARFPAGLTPHLSVGQARSAQVADCLLTKLRASWQPIRFDVAAVALIRRTADSPFRVEQQLALAGIA